MSKEMLESFTEYNVDVFIPAKEIEGIQSLFEERWGEYRNKITVENLDGTQRNLEIFEIHGGPDGDWFHDREIREFCQMAAVLGYSQVIGPVVTSSPKYLNSIRKRGKLATFCIATFVLQKS